MYTGRHPTEPGQVVEKQSSAQPRIVHTEVESFCIVDVEKHMEVVTRLHRIDGEDASIRSSWRRRPDSGKKEEIWTREEPNDSARNRRC
jgi:hypothetical protein